ncbi:MAG: 7-carboxy-7-deazaguanine synthase QueE [Rhodothermales bacterium]
MKSVDGYPVVDHYYTIQGEGTYAGRAAYFIRLAGCDVGCPWCDTKESWSLDGRPIVPTEVLVHCAVSSGGAVVVVTGGEPTMHQLGPLVDSLHEAGLEVHLETSGAYEITGAFDWVTLSPKKYSPPVAANYALVDELKVVVAHRSDFEWGERHLIHCPDGVHASFQPEWESPTMLPLIVEYVKEHPKWQISLQTHKYLGIA